MLCLSEFQIKFAGFTRKNPISFLMYVPSLNSESQLFFPIFQAILVVKILQAKFQPHIYAAPLLEVGLHRYNQIK